MYANWRCHSGEAHFTIARPLQRITMIKLDLKADSTAHTYLMDFEVRNTDPEGESWESQNVIIVRRCVASLHIPTQYSTGATNQENRCGCLS